MTLPPHFATLDLSGRFILNHTLSDCYEDILQEQGLDDSKLRCAVTGGVLSLNHYEDENGSQRIWVQQDLAGCSRIADDHRILDWHDRARNDALFGAVVEKMRRIKTPSLQPPFLRTGWTPDTLKYGVLQYHVSTDSDATRNHRRRKWTVVETWGIETAEGERRFARHIRLTGPGGLEMERHLVYDYIGAI
ncbi:hypothetical protein MSAN_01646300 [Mycena sanguinolenta]|uniref:Uncharacterized protein n=1 Tax=Mycena sanguinolenta TaxID=230812 RepID=A0A8H6Y065_9AGAR|nr:hypothetical protein MSAN_01646300 [Mycena sanguinolenta]